MKLHKPEALQRPQEAVRTTVGSQGYHLAGATIAEHLSTLDSLLLVRLAADNLEVALANHLRGEQQEDSLPMHWAGRQQAPKDAWSLGVMVDQAGRCPTEKTIFLEQFRTS